MSTCVDMFSDSAVIRAVINPGSAASSAESRKHDKYRDLAKSYIFQPVTVETTGGFGPSTLSFIKQPGKCISA